MAKSSTPTPNVWWNVSDQEFIVPDAVGGAKVVEYGDSVTLADADEDWSDREGWSRTQPPAKPAPPVGEPGTEPTA